MRSNSQGQDETSQMTCTKNDQGIYLQKVHDMVANNGIRIAVNINDLRRKNPKRCQQLLNDSFEELVCFQRALKDLVTSSDPLYGKQHEEFFIGFEGSFGDKHNTPRSLTSKYLGNMVCLEGIVTKCSLIRPKIVRSVHYCPVTKKTLERKYTDMTSLDAHPTSGVYPTKDEDGNLLETEYGLCVYKDHQTFSIQEMPEKAPPGQLPRSVDIVADNDLVDSCKPGDRVQVVGMFRCLPAKKNGFTSGTFRTILIANNVSLMSKEISPLYSADDVAKIKKFARDKKQNAFEVLARSLAPSIHGHEHIKRAVLCMLLGGNEKVLANGTRLRGDINVLLIGDPSVAKSQMLRYVLHTAPRAIPTTGRGSSGVGLTAAVTTDQETGDKRLEAGAMVLGDRGVVCIDEFDKMSDIDRTAIHEVMEQGRVTIAKAGIHAKLNARCSVLAAANPVYGRYNQFKTPMENIGLQDSLLSRFDLLFIVLDKMDPESDRRISDHVLRMHLFRAAGEQDGDVLPMGSSAFMLATQDPDAENEENLETPVYEKRDTFLHGSGKRGEKIVSMQFMRKYIHIAKGMRPVLTRPASDYIAEEYAKLRNQDNLGQENIARTQPVTARTLETIIRLSTAHAKARLSKTVELQDAEAAIELIEFAYFKKVLEKEKRSKRKAKDSEGEESQDEEAGENDGDENVPPRKKQRTPRKSRKPQEKGEDGYDPYDSDAIGTEDEPVPLEEDRRKRRASSSAPTTPVAEQQSGITDDRLKVFRSSLYQLYKKERAQSVQLQQVKDYMAAQHTSQVFTEEEILAAIDKMMDENQVMLSDNIVFLV
ncbi:DNA helicase [Plakobranchus ocellatus]|uniref:DNA replication licensing factor MCM3 n=1 Tax=Plakobranchus ocellatus TaxID=259542 RepID=A0AAV4B0V2_9GAST|nr:DNA helicase [Plakobranchus ocellatus]